MERSQLKDDLSQQDKSVLLHLKDKKSPEEIAELTRLRPHIIGEKIARLQVAGFISAEGRLTEKGLEALGENV